MTTFTVDVNYQGMIALTNAFTIKPSLDRHLARLLESAQAAELAGDNVLEQRLIDRYVATVDRNADRNLAPDDAALLVYLAGYL